MNKDTIFSYTVARTHKSYGKSQQMAFEYILIVCACSAAEENMCKFPTECHRQTNRLLFLSSKTTCVSLTDDVKWQ